ncbi:MAG: transposase [Rubrobacter sp.]
MIECKLVTDGTQTDFVPLCAFGHYLTRNEVLRPLRRVRVPQKTVEHSPQEKLTDALIGMLAGCSALYELNVRVRPDLPLQEAFGRESCAEQSTVSDTLDAFDGRAVEGLREAVEAIHRGHSRIFAHDFGREMLVVEVDLTGLAASARAEGSTKGYFPHKRNRRGRQLARVSAPRYGEILFEKLHAGNTNSSEVLKETVTEVERVLGLAEEPEKRKRTLIRIDGGFGTDENLNWLCWRGYQFVAKGYSGGRAKKVAKSVPEGGWREGPTPGQALGRPEEPHRYGRRTLTVARRWTDAKGKPHQDLLISTMSELGDAELAELYDGRGAMEVDIKGDKRGLNLEKRRKRSFHAQEALALLAQLAHNLLAWFKRWFLAGTKAGRLGTERLVREVMAMPGQVSASRWRAEKVRVKLPNLHPWAEAVAKGIRARFPRSGWRALWGES